MILKGASHGHGWTCHWGPSPFSPLTVNRPFLVAAIIRSGPEKVYLNTGTWLVQLQVWYFRPPHQVTDQNVQSAHAVIWRQFRYLHTIIGVSLLWLRVEIVRHERLGSGSPSGFFCYLPSSCCSGITIYIRHAVPLLPNMIHIISGRYDMVIGEV